MLAGVGDGFVPFLINGKENWQIQLFSFNFFLLSAIYWRCIYLPEDISDEEQKVSM